MTDLTIMQGANLYPGINKLTSLHCLQKARPQTRPESCYLWAWLVLMSAKKTDGLLRQHPHTVNEELNEQNVQD